MSTDQGTTITQADTLDVPESILSALKDVAALSNVPFLQEAAGLALSSFNSVKVGTSYHLHGLFIHIAHWMKGARQSPDSESLYHLVEDTCSLVYAVSVIYRELDKNGTKLSVDFVDHLRGLLEFVCGPIFNFFRVSSGLAARSERLTDLHARRLPAINLRVPFCSRLILQRSKNIARS